MYSLFFNKKTYLCIYIFLMSQLAYGISGNDQLKLAGMGKFDVLASKIEEMSRDEKLKVADWHALCFAYSKIKNYQKILKCLDQFEKSMEGNSKRGRLFGLDDVTPTVYLMRSEALVELGQYEKSILEADRAISWYKKEKSNDKDIFINAVATKAIANALMGKNLEAEKFSRQLDEIHLGIFDNDFVGAKSMALARVNMILGKWQQVIDALAIDKFIGFRAFIDNIASGAYLAGINNWVWIELPRGFMQAKAQFELGQISVAKINFDKILAVPEVIANGEIYWMLLFDRGRIAEIEGKIDEAEIFYLRAAEIIENQRKSINTEANKIGFVGNKQLVYKNLIEIQFVNEKYGKAFEIVERAKSRALVDLLAEKNNFLVAKNTLNNKSSQIVLDEIKKLDEESRLQFNSNFQPENLIKIKNKEVKTLAQNLNPELSSLVSVSAVDLNEIQSIIEKNESMLIYYGDSNQMYALVVTKNSVKGAKIATANLEKDVNDLRDMLQHKSQPIEVVQRKLFDRLIKPVDVYLKDEILTIVPHAILHYLPFSALLDNENSLVDKFNLRILPSASALKYLRNSGKKKNSSNEDSIFIIGNPDLKNPNFDLPGSQVEAEEIATHFSKNSLFLRNKATKNAFRNFSSTADYIHIASHGKFDALNPLQSGLLLAPENGDNGLMTVSDIYELNLNAEMVVLSACDTGLGKILNGDDVVGLSRGFMYAGASTIIASLWQVDDDATTFLMVRLYEYIKTARPLDALRRAQIETRKKYPHPYFWASFNMIGRV